MGGPVPVSYYLCNKNPEACEDDGKIYLHLSAGGKKMVEFHVDAPASILQYYSLFCRLVLSL